MSPRRITPTADVIERWLNCARLFGWNDRIAQYVPSTRVVAHSFLRSDTPSGLDAHLAQLPNQRKLRDELLSAVEIGWIVPTQEGKRFLAEVYGYP